MLTVKSRKEFNKNKKLFRFSAPTFTVFFIRSSQEIGLSQRVGLSWAVELFREVGFSQRVGLSWAVELSREVGLYQRMGL